MIGVCLVSLTVRCLPGHWGCLGTVGPGTQMTFISALTGTSPYSHITPGSKAGASLSTDGGHRAKGPCGPRGKYFGEGVDLILCQWELSLDLCSLTSLHISKQHSFMNKHQDIKYFHTLC